MKLTLQWIQSKVSKKTDCPDAAVAIVQKPVLEGMIRAATHQIKISVNALHAPHVVNFPVHSYLCHPRNVTVSFQQDPHRGIARLVKQLVRLLSSCFFSASPSGSSISTQVLLFLELIRPFRPSLAVAAHIDGLEPLTPTKTYLAEIAAPASTPPSSGQKRCGFTLA